MTCTDVKRMHGKVEMPAKPRSGRIFRGALLAVLLVCVAVMVSLYLHNANVEQQIQIQQEYRDDAIAELERNEGTYDAQSIVLYNTSRAQAEELAEKLGASLRMTKDGSFATLTLPEGTTILDVYRDEDNLVYLEQMSADYQVSISELIEGEEDKEGSDERLPMRPIYTVSDTDYELQTYLDYMNMQDVWASCTGYGSTVAVIDTGIDTDHPEFAGRISEYSYNATEDKIVKDYLLEDGSYDWSLVEDEQGHGTAVTGVIAASMNSGNVVGIAPNVSIITIKAECDESGKFKRTSDLVFGLYYAIERDVSVVNMSFGGEDQLLWEAALQLAFDSDVICVAAAGNESTAALTYPAAAPNVIGVGALADGSWELAEYSNYGENVNVVAPGTTYTTLMGGTYGTIEGTSLSCPTVTGAIALLLAHNTYMEYSTVIELLQASSSDLGDPGCDWYYGYGALDVSALVLEERGTVTFNMMTDELDNTNQLFIRGHVLQNMPEPERLYAVFDGWYYDVQCTEEYNLYSDRFISDLTLYAKWVNEDDGIPFTYVELDDGSIEIRSYTGKRRYITIPDYIEGKPVTSIGRAAFSGNTRLVQVNLPKDLVYIHDSAFEGCSSLINIVIPDTVQSIGEKAFYNNIRLSSVSLGANSALMEIGEMTFAGCSKLRGFTIPASVTKIAENAFYLDTAILSFDVLSGNSHYTAVDGCLCNADATRMICYPYGRRDAAVIPSGITVLGTYSFQYARLSGIADWGNVQTIEDAAFYSSWIRGDLAIPDQIISMGTGVFKNNDYILTVQFGAGIEQIPAQAFEDCGSLQSVVFSDNTTRIGYAAFFKCVCLTNMVLPARIEEIASSAFRLTSITELHVPASLKIIDSSAFDQAPVALLTFAENSSLTKIGGEAFSQAKISNIVFPQSLEYLGDYAFYRNLIAEVTIPENVSYFGSGVFAGCGNLKAIELVEENPYYNDFDGVVYTEKGDVIVAYPSGKTAASYEILPGIEKVGASAFSNTLYLRNVIVPDGTEIIGVSAFALSSVETVHIGNGLTTIEAQAFQYADCLASVNLPEGLMSVGVYAFEGTESLHELLIPESLTVLTEYSFYGCGARYYVLPETLTEIEAYAMASNTNLQYLVIPDRVAHIGKYAFSGNFSMTSVALSDNTSMTRFSFESFAYCGVSSFRIPAKISSIAQGAFTGCSNLTSFIFAENSQLESISAYMFDGCSNLETITFEQGSALTSVQARGFEGMTKLTSIDFGNASLTNIDNFAFKFCASLTEITIPEGVTNIGRFAFYYCTGLTDVALPASLEHIGRGAFIGAENVNLYFASQELPRYLDEDWDWGIRGYYVGVVEVLETEDWEYALLTDGGIALLKYKGSDTHVNLNDLDLGGQIISIGGECFRDAAVVSVVLPDTLVNIQAEAFYGSMLASVIVPKSVVFIGRSAFAQTPMTSLAFEEGSALTVIEQSAFEGTKNLVGVELPASLTTLGKAVFKNSGIAYVKFAEGFAVSEIPEEAFAYTKLSSVVIPDSVSLINHNAFRECASLKTVTFGTADEIRIMSNAFYQSGLETLTIPKNVTYIGEYAFVALTNLTEFRVDQNNPYYSSVDGVLLADNGRKLVAMPAGRTGSYTVPSGIEIIGFGAFEESALSEIKFSEQANILSLGYRAFYRAQSLTSIHIPASVISIDYYAFANCTQLQSVTFEQSSGLTGVYEGVFYGCINLSDIMLPDGVIEISDFAFYGCAKMTEIPITENSELKGIYGYAMAYTGIRGDFVVPETVFDIGEYAFMGTKITSITIHETNAWDLVIGIGAFEDCRNVTEVTLPFVGASFEDSKIGWFGYIFGAGSYQANAAYVPESLTKITLVGDLTELGVGAFYDLASIQELVLPENISVLGEYCFEGTTVRYTLTNPVLGKGNDIYGNDIYMLSSSMFGQGFYGHLIIDDAVSVLGSNTFKNLDRLTGVTIGKGINEIPGDTFWECHNLSSIVIPDNVTTIAGWAFYDCIRLKYVEIGAGVQYLDQNAFQGCSIVEFKISEDNTNYQIIDGVVYDNPVTQIIYVTAALPPKVVIPEGLTRIPVNTFFSNAVLEIVFPDSVEIIESSAVDCSNLQTVTFGKGLVTIEWYAFGFPENLQVIYNNSSLPLTFDNGDELTRVASLIVSANGDKHYRDPSSGFETIDTADGFRFTKSYGQYTLHSYLGSETSIVLPESIQGHTYTINKFVSNAREICLTDGVQLTFNVMVNGNLPFGGCTLLQSFAVADNCEKYRVIDGVLYNADLTELLAVPKGRTGKITVPGSVESIPYRAFAETAIKEVTISEGVKYIVGEAFDSCRELERVSLPNTLVQIGNSAFMECESLIEIDIPSGVSYIEEFAFYGCVSLERVTMHEGLQTIGGVAFQGCKSLKKVSLPSGVMSIGSGAFHGCHADFEVSIPDSVQQMTNAFVSTATLIFPDSFVTIDGIVYNTNTMNIVHAYPERITGRVEIPDGVTVIPSGVFEGTSVTEVILPDSVQTLAGGVFTSCANLQRVVLSSALTNISDETFSNCTALTEIVIPEGVESIGSRAFSHCTSLRSVVLPDSLRTIEYSAFYDCVALESLTLPSEFVSFKDGAFQGCSKLELLAESDMQHYTVLNGIWYADHMTTIAYVSPTLSGDVIIAEGVVNIGSALMGHSEITSITLPDSFSMEYPYSFSVYGCDNLQAFYVSDSHPLYTSIDGVLYDKDVTQLLRVPVVCGRLEIAEGITVIPNTAFETGSMSGLREIVLPSTLIEINDTFMYIYGIEVIYNHSVLPITCGSWDFGGIAVYAKAVFDANGNRQYADGVWEYDILNTDDGFVFKRENGEYTLLGYKGEAETVTLPTSINGQSYRIYNFTGAAHVIIPEGWTEISEHAFSNSTKLISISIPSSVVSIGNGAFSGCVNLQSATLPEGLERIEDNAFAHCYSLASPTFPSTLVYLGGYAYYRCGFASVRIPANILVFGDSVFKECSNLTEVILEEGLTSLPGFAYCTALAQIDIPQSVISISANCFEACTALREITIPENVTSIGSMAFLDCASLASIRVGDKIETIGKEAFLNTAFYRNPDNWMDNVLYLHCYMIRVKEDVKYFELPENVTCIAQGAYDNCYMLKIAYANGPANYLLETATNIETLVIFGRMPTHLWDYFGWSVSDIPLTLKNVILDQSVRMQNNVFAGELEGGITGLNIYAEQLKQDTMWDENYPGWQNGNRVYYGETWKYVRFYGAEGMLVSKDFVLNAQVIRVPWMDYYKDNAYVYIFSGFDMDGDGIADMIPATSTVDIAATALYQAIPICEAEGHKAAASVKENDTKPTCTEKGGYVEVINCTVCGVELSREYREVDALGHKMGERYQTVLPTCTTEGENRRDCNRCDHRETEVVPANGHGDCYVVERDRFEPTCTEPGGYDMVAYCTICSAELSREHYDVDAFGHEMSEWYQAALPTCTTQGENRRDCYRGCGYCETEAIPAKGHMLAGMTEENYVDPTCTEPGGYDMVTYCIVCWAEVSREHYDIDALGHDMADWYQTVTPACATEGENRRDCCRCDYFETEVVPAKGHIEDYAVNTDRFEPTCTEIGGYDTIVCCAVCGAELSREHHSITALGHDLGEWYQSIVPACTTKGENTRDCSRCAYFETEVVLENGHTEAAVVVENRVEPTCTEAGGYDEVIYCIVCGSELSREHMVLGTLVHSYEVVVTHPTCTEQGYTTHTCHCGDSYVDSHVDALGHTLSDWIVDIEAQIGVEGSKHKECTVCGETLETESIEALTETPTTEPPETDVPATKPPETDVPATEPPETDVPTTEPPETDVPATEPPTTDPEPSGGCNGTISVPVVLLALLSCIAVGWRSRKDD